MAWVFALLGLLGAFVFFLGAAVCLIWWNKRIFKTCMIGFFASFALAFLAVGLH